MLSYDPAFNPPAPCIDVRVLHPLDVSRSAPCRAKLDTGADMCVIPSQLVDQLQLRPYRTIVARGYDRIPTPRDVYVIRIDLEGQRIGPLDAVATPREDLLLGRNALNHFVITLDGKNLTFELRDP